MASSGERSSYSETSDDLEMQDVEISEKDQLRRLIASEENGRSNEEDLQLQQRLDLKGEREGQTQKLLESYRDDDDDGSSEHQAFKIEWHIRTPWVIAGSVAAAAIVFAVMVLFTRFIIVQETVNVERPQLEHSEGFRRPSSDYILDPKWDFDAPAQTRHYKWTIGDIIANPDGVFRPMIAINGQFPGPMIECNEGDTLEIEVDNQSINATSIHFHGLYQNGTNWMDGTSGITQCPIVPRERFTYRFNVSGQYGTYYYHGHQAIQASDGLVGPLVIHSRMERKLETLKYSSDRVVMVQDYYHDLSSALLYETMMPGNEGSPIPNGALINGRNTRDCSTVTGRTCNNATASLPSFDLAADKSHKLRFINVGAFAWFQVELDEHEFALIEVDGTQIVPSYKNRLMISPAQRYSVVIQANKQTGSSFWLRARMVTYCFSNWRLPMGSANEVRAVVSYTSKEGALVSPPASKNWEQAMEVECRDIPLNTLVPADPIPAPPQGKTYYLRSNLEIGDWRLERGFFNKSSFRAQLDKPSLHRTIDGLRTSNDSFDSLYSGTNDIAFDYKREFVIQHHGIQTVDLIIENFDEGNHPMHLHGHKFWVLGQGHTNFRGYESLDQEYLKNPLRRDVATLEGYGWMVIRFVTDNPGMWAFHCHMAWHSETGLVMQFMNRPEIMKNWEVPEANAKLCEAPIKALEKGAAPKDDIWFGFGIGKSTREKE